METKKTEESKCNKEKGNFTFSPHTEWIQLNCKVIKNLAIPHFYINLTFSGLSPLFRKAFSMLLAFIKWSYPSILQIHVTNMPKLTNSNTSETSKNVTLLPLKLTLNAFNASTHCLIERFATTAGINLSVFYHASR